MLSDNRHKWYDIGILLQVDRNILDNLKNSDFVKLFGVIDNFLTTQPSSVTWATVISAIESPIINDKNIADLIREYLRVGKKNKLLLLSNEVINSDVQTTTVKCI